MNVKKKLLCSIILTPTSSVSSLIPSTLFFFLIENYKKKCVNYHYFYTPHANKCIHEYSLLFNENHWYRPILRQSNIHITYIIDIDIYMNTRFLINQHTEKKNHNEKLLKKWLYLSHMTQTTCTNHMITIQRNIYHNNFSFGKKSYGQGFLFVFWKKLLISCQQFICECTVKVPLGQVNNFQIWHIFLLQDLCRLWCSTQYYNRFMGLQPTTKSQKQHRPKPGQKAQFSLSSIIALFLNIYG